MKGPSSSPVWSIGAIFTVSGLVCVSGAANNSSRVCDVCDGYEVPSPSRIPLPQRSPLPATPETDPWFMAETASSYLGNYDDFWEELECSTLFDKGGPRPIHPKSTWTLMRGVYYGIVGPQQSTIDYLEVPPDGHGFFVPIRVEHIPGKGRAVIAAEDIPKGTKVWDSTYTARFPSPVYFRRFLSSLPTDLACDVMIWAYAEDHAWNDDDDERPTISVDLDEGTLLNTVDNTNGHEKNVDNENCEATRLIRKGEELLVDYRDFEKEFSWTAAGFGSADEADDYFWGI